MSGDEVRAAALVADPAGDADREPEFEVAASSSASPVKQCATPRHCAPCSRRMARKSACASRWCRNTGLPSARASSSWRWKACLLRRRGRVVAEVIESALADRDHLARARQLRRARPGVRARARPRDADARRRSRTASPRVRARQRDRARACSRGVEPVTISCTTPGGARAREHRIAVGVVAVVREVDADVDERRGAAAASVRGGYVMVVHACRAFY